MIFLKTEREFIDGMWDKVSQLEYEEMQTKYAQVRHKKIMITNILTTFSIIIASILFIIWQPSISETIFYIISTISLTAAYHIEKFLSNENKSERIKLYENRNND